MQFKVVPGLVCNRCFASIMLGFTQLRNFSKAIIGLAGFMLAIHLPVSAQLNLIAPVLLAKGQPGNKTKFTLTTMEEGALREKFSKFASAVQIIDADAPWPPRWFTTVPLTKPKTGNESDLDINIVMNASVQNKRFSFIEVSRGGNGGTFGAIISCNNKMEQVGYFSNDSLRIDPHDFRVLSKNRILYFQKADTIADVSAITGNAVDTAVSVSFEKIQIRDAKGKIIFDWNPIHRFGWQAVYSPYLLNKSFVNSGDDLNWSHGNSLAFDKDGNILYSFKLIGIGKISKKDGHFIWRVDRTQIKINAASDSLPIFLQHDLEWATDSAGNEFYTVLSNGDVFNPESVVYQFYVKDSAGYGPVLRIKKIIKSDDLVSLTFGGNYEVEPSGNYLVNYGYSDSNDDIDMNSDTAKYSPAFEYRSKADTLLGKYCLPASVFCYRVHYLDSWKPARPVIVIGPDSLTAKGTKDMTDYRWYRLSGLNCAKVVEVGRGQSFTPSKNGPYCVVAKYGIGYSVSKLVAFTVKNQVAK